MPKRFAFPVFAILIVLLAYTGYWFYARGQIAQSVAEWEAVQVAAGYEISHSPVEIGGFPYRFSVATDAVVIQAPAREGGWTIELESFRANALPYDFSHWIISLGNTARLEQGGQALDFMFGDARFSVSGNGGVTQRIGAEVSAMTIQADGPASSVVTGVSDLRLSAATSETGEMAVRVQLDEVGLAEEGIDPVLFAAFGDEITRLQADFVISQWNELARSADLAAWSQADGQYTLREFHIDWGRLDMDAEGQMTLDEALRPQGRISLNLLDPEAVVDALIETGSISQENAGAMRLVAQSAPRGENGTAVPLAFRNGGVYFGPVRLGAVGPVID
ncbi:DUF2125 domain-containing protein [Hyphobacterium sp.]|uniref:DUF2125 domain-containing protein n=1 Tax=Hyphobacterium sp. TaxID=2004662 RepID=UPI003BABF64B